MELWDHLLGRKNREEPSLLFGRYSDAYKDSGKYDAWDLSIEKFVEGKFMESYRLFLDYLYDEEQENVSYREEGGSLHFDILQGSKKISGEANELKVSAGAQLATSHNPDPALLKQLLERNFDLTFSRYALDPDGNIHILFDTYTIDGSPYKLYYALKELALNADKLDDLLLAEYASLSPVDASIIREIPDQEKEVKYRFFQSSIRRTLKVIDTYSREALGYPSAVAYLILDLSYKLDYLLKPEGLVMEGLERIHRLHFAQDGDPIEKRIERLAGELESLGDMKKEPFYREMYQVSATFGITKPVSHKQVAGFIQGEINHLDWYLENGFPEAALAIPGYIVGYCLFNYALPLPDRQFFHLYYQIMEEAYFRELGFSDRSFWKNKQQLNGRHIRKAIREIRETCEDKYEGCEPALDDLNFESLPGFARSYLEMVRDLDFHEISS